MIAADAFKRAEDDRRPKALADAIRQTNITERMTLGGPIRFNAKGQVEGRSGRRASRTASVRADGGAAGRVRRGGAGVPRAGVVEAGLNARHGIAAEAQDVTFLVSTFLPFRYAGPQADPKVIVNQ